MIDPDDRRYGSATIAVGWAFGVIFGLHSVLGSIMPRLEKESAIREAARGWHYLLGIIIFALAVWLLVRWRREGHAIPPGRLPPAIRAWHRLLALTIVTVLLLIAPLGFLNGWGEGRTIHLAGLVALPDLLAPDRAMWQFAGYFHAALSNGLVFISLIGVVSAAYTYLRYKRGLLTAFPPGIGFAFLAKSLVFIYAINSFKALTPGFIALAIALALVAAVWAIGALLRRNGATEFPSDTPPVTATALAGVAVAALIGFGLYAPYLMFRVTPFASGVKVAADPSITWHVDRVAQVEIAPPTAFERTVAEQTYKWCRFCHTVEAGAAALVGPNLHNIFGQRAGTVPNFYYSEAMAEAGRKGLVWNDETLAAYIAGPDKFVPGTSMIISSGPVTDSRARAAVINLLKRETMTD